MPEHPIRAILKADERSVAWLARKLGYHSIYVNMMLNGYWNPSAKFRRACSEFLQRPESELFLPTKGPVRPKDKRKRRAT